jgi:prepilin-type N-terminal cleavage/methylation domain-containing protein
MKGFTLLEILIALTIMATLTVLSSQSIQQAIKSKIKLQAQIDEMSRVRDSLRVIERDINLAFHYRDLQMEFDAEVYKQKKAAPREGIGGTTGTAPPPPPPGTPGAIPDDPAAFMNDPKTKERYQNRKDPTTEFVGKESSIDFATSNVARISEGELLADFAKVGYSVKSCKKMDQTGNSEQCLVRRLSPFVEGDITKGGAETVLLEDVSEFKLRYFGAGKQDWVSDWDSRSQDGATKGNFPLAVEVSLTIEVAPPNNPNGKKKKVSMQLVAPIRFPNNKEKSESTVK